MIYCVHGKPSIGCCTVTGQIVNDNDDSTSTTSQQIDQTHTAKLSTYQLANFGKNNLILLLF